MDLHNLVSFAGIFILAAFAWLISDNRRIVNRRLLVWGIGLQLLLAVFICLFPMGTTLFLAANDAIVTILDAASAGSRFLFGRLAVPPGGTGASWETSLGFILAFTGISHHCLLFGLHGDPLPLLRHAEDCSPVRQAVQQAHGDVGRRLAGGGEQRLSRGGIRPDLPHESLCGRHIIQLKYAPLLNRFQPEDEDC